VSRLRRIEQRQRYFFVTTNLLERVPELTPGERSHVLEQLDRTRMKMGFFLYSYVVMPTHVHLLLWPQQSDLTAVMRDLKSKTALALAAKRGSPGPFWQPRFFDFICRRVSDFHGKMDYIHNNPVEAGLIARAEDWPWSSAAFHLKAKKPMIRVDEAKLPVGGNALLWPAR
jgi:REP-associated tyrosine transposase